MAEGQSVRNDERRKSRPRFKWLTLFQTLDMWGKKSGGGGGV